MSRTRPCVRNLRAAALVLFLSEFCLGAAVASGDVSGRSPESEFERIRAAWRERLTQMATVRYALEGQALFAAGSLVQPDDPDIGPEDTVPLSGLPAQDTTYDVRFEWLLDFENSRLRKEMHDMSFNMQTRTFRPFVRIEVFDGDGLKGYWPRELNTSPQYIPHRNKEELILWRDDDVSWISYPYDIPVLHAHGLFSLDVKALRSGTADRLPNLRAREVASLEGRPCVVLVNEGHRKAGTRSVLTRDIFFVDTERTGAVLRHEHRANDRLVWQLDVDHREYAFGWFPAGWVFTEYDSSWSESELPGVRSRYEIRVVSIEADPAVSRSDFAVPMRPGMNVLRRADMSRLRVAEDGRTLVPVGQDPGEGYTRAPAIVSLCGAAALVGIALVARRWRRMPGRSGCVT